MIANISWISKDGIQFSPKEPSHAAFLDRIMESLEPPKTLPFIQSAAANGKKCFHWKGVMVFASTPEEEAFLNELEEAIRQGGDIVSARVFCDGGWMAIFKVPAWKNRDPKEYFAAVGQGPR